MAYAEATSVPSERSRGEIERTLARYGAEQFMYGWNAANALVGFVVRGKQVRFVLPMPDRQSREFICTPTGRPRSATQAEQAYEQGVRQRWRALALVIKAKLEAVETGIVTFESEFLAHIMLPNGQSVGDWIEPQVDQAYDTGEMPALLPAIRGEIEA